MIESAPTIEIPDLDEYLTITQAEEEIYWSYDLPDDLRGSISVGSSKKSIPRATKYKLRHEFVAETLTGLDIRTDVKLSAIFPSLNDDDDILTPDVMYEDPNGIVFSIELATIRSTRLDAINRTFREKHFKYEQALQNRATAFGKTVVYIPIVVSPTSVYSNITIDEDVVNELMIRMKVATTLENLALHQGFTLAMTEMDEIMSVMAQDIKDGISNIKNVDRASNSKVFISDDFIETCKRDANLEHVVTCFSTSVNKAGETMDRAKTTTTSSETFERAFYAPENRRRDDKPIILFPGLIPAITKPSSLPTRVRVLEVGQGREEAKMWNEAFSQMTAKDTIFMEEDQNSLMKEAFETKSKTLKEMVDLRHKKRSKYHVVNLKNVLTTKIVQKISKDGVFGKSQKDKLENKISKEKKKLSYYGHSNTKDVESFLSNPLWLQKIKQVLPESTRSVIDLIDKGNKFMHNNHFCIQEIHELSSTNLFQYLEFISDVAIELAISFKTNVNRSQFILKKIRNYNAYLLIKPTNSRSHMFYSILIPKNANNVDLGEGPFKKYIDGGSAYYTEFCSVREDKIENLATMSASFFSFVAFWCNFYVKETYSIETLSTTKELLTMLLITILIKLEDKAETEETITITRYMYMELFKGGFSICKSDPFKMLTKMTSRPRSRLNVFVINRVLINFKSMLLSPPKKELSDMTKPVIEGEDCLPDDEWSGLLNFFTGTPVKSASRIINLCYLGYVKNKNEVSQDNSSYKLIEKILDEELSFDPARMEQMNGKTIPTEIPRSKEFNVDCVIKGCQLMEKRFKSMLGPGWKAILEREIFNNLSKAYTCEIATLKASSQYDHKKIPSRVTKETNGEIHRIKVIEALAIKLGLFGVNPYLKLEEIMSIIENHTGGVVSDLFKKNQHGGLREIYVLTIESRIVQLFIETISRTICSHFDEETLTHPENKLSLLDKHKVRSGKLGRYRNSLYADLCSSSDKKRWNQNFVMPVMSIPLFRMTTDIFHNPIKRIMNMWADKLIKIPPSVCNLLLSRTHMTSESYEALLLKFWRPLDPSVNASIVRSQCASFVNTTSGMMQGILHYTSSLLHLTFLQVGTYCVLGTLRKMHPSYKFTMTQVCSSDDSASIVTVLTPPGVESMNIERYRPIYLTEKLLLSLTYFCQFFCMRESDKSTISVPDYVEFNSEFIFKNTVAKPLIKLTAACTNLTESESFIDRFHTMYNLITDLYASGMDSKNCLLTQIGQSWIHYKTMGAGITGLFLEYHDYILEYPHPSMGFYGFDSELCCGLSGFSFILWSLITTNVNLYKGFQFMNLQEMQSTKDGSITTSLSVKHGDYKKWYTLMDVINEGTSKPSLPSVVVDKRTKDWKLDERRINARRSLMNQNIELLFRKPTNKAETKIKLLFKASMPGVGKSLGRGNPFMQSLSMSVYSIFTHCLSRSSVTTEMFHGVQKLKKTSEKLSLLLALKTEITRVGMIELDSIDHSEVEANIKICYPLHDRYKELQLILEQYTEIDPVRVHRIRQRKSMVMIQPTVHDLPLNLYSVVSKLWFSFSLKTTERIYNRCLDTYRVLLPWLKDTFEETLQSSPFETPTELYNFVSRQSSKTRKILFTGPGIFSNYYEGQVRQLIQKNYMVGYLTNPMNDPVFPKQIDVEELSKLSLAMQIPLNTVRDRLVNRLMRAFAIGNLNKASLKLRSVRIATLQLLSHYSAGNLTKEEFIDVLNDLKMGTIISFTKEQDRVIKGGQQLWEGTGEAIMQIEGHYLKITMDGKFAVRVVTPDWRGLRANPGVLKLAFENLGVSACKKQLLTPRGVARFQGSRFVPMTSMGTPIVVDKEMERLYLTPRTLHYKIFRGKCGMYTKIKDKYQPILEIKSYSKDMPATTGTLEDGSIWDHWVDYSPCSMEKSFSFLKKLDEKLVELGVTHPNVAPVIKWLSDTLLNRLRFRGIGYVDQDYTTSLAESEDQMMADMAYDDMEWLDDLIDEDLEGGLDECLMEKVMTELKPEQKEEEELDQMIDQMLMTDTEGLDILHSIIHNWTQEEQVLSKSIFRREAFDYLYMHPVWDSLIDQVNRMDPNFFIRMLRGVTSDVDRTLSEMLMRLLRIEVQKRSINITSRFKNLRISSIDDGLDSIEEDNANTSNSDSV
uniref:RdRp catalytic domain-containing protein n=1 Tax=Riboviria sp. TaxID=2585031 RepID=A0A8K1U3S3_9VIRU|nr:MAG: hypothetical protein [Riboviria sp.]